MKEMLLVDGYNVINYWPELIALRDNLEHARDKLVDILAGYGAYKDYNVVVVFDAHSSRGGSLCQEVVPDIIKVVYTREDETADSYIERMAYRLVREGREVYVVTSDRLEQMTVLGAGAWRISARELVDRLIETDQKIMDKYGRAILHYRRNELEARLDRDTLKQLNGLHQGRKP